MRLSHRMKQLLFHLQNGLTLVDGGNSNTAGHRFDLNPPGGVVYLTLYQQRTIDALVRRGLLVFEDGEYKLTPEAYEIDVSGSELHFTEDSDD